MITAKEARKIAKEYNLPNDILKQADREIKVAAKKGEYELPFDCGTNSEEVIKIVVAELKKAGYQITHVPHVSTIVIYW